MHLNYIFLENKNYHNDCIDDLVSIMKDQQRHFALVYLLFFNAQERFIVMRHLFLDF